MTQDDFNFMFQEYIDSGDNSEYNKIFPTLDSLVASIIWKSKLYNSTHYNFEEVKQHCHLEIIECVKKGKFSESFNHFSFLVGIIRISILHYKHESKEKTYRKYVSNISDLANDTTDTTDYLERLQDEYNVDTIREAEIYRLEKMKLKTLEFCEWYKSYKTGKRNRQSPTIQKYNKFIEYTLKNEYELSERSGSYSYSDLYKKYYKDSTTSTEQIQSYHEVWNKKFKEYRKLCQFNHQTLL